ncbi:hypothetical protein EB796_012554 [Bugula neritina]|uniref:ABC-2 type transporter transmembrane domain-containing protein n=1 Tax=Bugula neritina TaxID=10212 RepID=A0A7J7JT52_BUGNE|nr:hypothetical protein EB796_012554 [Bugula neritina]
MLSHSITPWTNIVSDLIFRKDNWVNMNGEVPFNSKGPSTEASNGAAGQKKVISKLSSHVTEFDEMEIDDDYTKYREEYESPWPTGFFLQFSVLFQRSVKYSFFRIYSKWHIMQFISLSIFIGMMWFQIEPTERQISNRQGVAFFFLIFTSFEFMLDSVLSAFNDRVVVNKERLAGYYRLSAYYLAKNLSEIPLLFGLASIFFTIIFWLSGLSPYFVDYLQMLGLLLLSAIVTHLFVSSMTVEITQHSVQSYLLL